MEFRIDSISEPPPFGRYKDKCLQEIAEQDYVYLEWVLRNIAMRAEVRKWVEEMTEELYKKNGVYVDIIDYILLKGKHKGKTIKEVMDIDAKWFTYMFRNSLQLKFSKDIRKWVRESMNS